MKILLLVVSFFSFALNIKALKNIKVNNDTLMPPFQKNLKVYNYYTNKDNIVISVSKEKNEIISGYGYFKIVDGKNTFKVGDYTVNVFKNYENTKGNALLKSITISFYNINFNPNVFEYTINTMGDSLDIDYEVESLGDKVDVTDKGNYILLNVYNEEISNTYKINIIKEEQVFKENIIEEFSNKEKRITAYIVIVIALLLIGLIFYIVLVKKLV